MSKFFRGSDSSESESSDSDDGLLREDKKRTAPQRMTTTDTRFLESDSDGDTRSKRPVLSAKDKRYGELKEFIRLLRNAKKIKDMNKSLNIFEDLCKSFTKAKPIMEREGAQIPRFYIRYLVELEDYVNATWADLDGRKKMSKQNSKGLSTLRQKLRKYISPEFETAVAAYRESPDPEGYSSAEEPGKAEESGSSESEDEAIKPKPKTKAQVIHKTFDGESDDDDDDWDSDDSSSSESELENLEGKKMEDLRKMFLKKTGTGKDDEEKRRRKEQKKIRQQRAEEMARNIDHGDWEEVGPGRLSERPKMFEKESDVTPEAVMKKLAEILTVRGKKGADRREMVELLKELKGIAEKHSLVPAISAKILFMIVAGMFEYNSKLSDCMKLDMWKSAMETINELNQLLVDNENIVARADMPDDVVSIEKAKEDGKFYVDGSLLALVERLDDEFIKILQVADCHSTDYVEKLKGEKGICSLIQNVQTYLEVKNEPKPLLCRIYIKRAEHLYYKLERTSPDKVEEEMARLCHFIYSHDSTRRLRERAILMHIYHHALHDRWQAARDLLLMSHSQSTIEYSDIPNQILYNRAMCQVGLCAFRHGLIKEAHSALSDIENSNRAKELLAQGLTMRSGQEKTSEQEKLERQRQIPYHMHVNLELLECVYLICSMLLEIPQMAARDYELRRKMLSRTFHYQLKQSERSSLNGPPENTREHVVAASRALLTGDWKACRDFIVNEKMNAKVWNLFPGSERVREMVICRIQEESLRTYLLTYSTVYTTVSLNVLADMFNLDKKQVHASITKMIICEELSGSLDEPAECLVMHRTEPTRLQLLSLQLTDKLGQFAENNDQILDPKPNQSYQNRGGNSNWFQNRQQKDGISGGGMHHNRGHERRRRNY